MQRVAFGHRWKVAPRGPRLKFRFELVSFSTQSNVGIVDPWILQAKRAFRWPNSARDQGIDSLVRGAALAEHAAAVGLDPTLNLVLSLGRALIAAGMPAYRVEEALLRLANALDLQIDALATPTSLIVTMWKTGSPPDEVRTRVVRIEPDVTDLGRLSALHGLVGRVERRELTPGDAVERIGVILSNEPRFDVLLTSLGYGLVSGASSVLLGGNAVDTGVSIALGTGVGFLSLLAAHSSTIGRLLPSLAAFMVALITTVLARYALAPIRPSVVLLAAIVLLLPGWTVTTATMELAASHVLSGTARLMGGIITFVQMGFGIALGRRVAPIWDSPPVHPSAGLPWIATLFAALASALGFFVLLRVRPRDAIWVLLAVSCAYLGAIGGGYLLGPELGAFVGALMTASAAHVFARLRDEPVNTMLVPGIYSLVPGTVGFLSLQSFLANDPSAAVGTGFRMAMVAMALAAGVLVATAAVPPRRAL